MRRGLIWAPDASSANTSDSRSSDTEAPPDYDPNRLLDYVMALLKIDGDGALAVRLGFSPGVISKVRHRKLPVSAELLVSLHEESRMEIGELRRMMGDRRQNFRAFRTRFRG